MVGIGKAWAEQVPLNAENRQILESGIERREAAAKEWIDHTRRESLPQGITSCISHKSDSLALPLPTDFITTRAVRDFLGALEHESLLTDIAVNADGPDTSLLLVTPMP